MLNYIQKEEVIEMMNVLKKYSGVLFFYLVIIGMILLISARFSDLNTESSPVMYAIND